MSSSGLGNGSRVGELLECLVPHKVHDYITEGICQALDGQHLLSVVRTGGGKTGYFYGFMLVLRALSRLPRTHPMARNIPQHPKIVIIYPTKGLAEEMESTFRKLSLSVVAINEDTLAAARRRDEDLWTTAKTTSMILLSPEQLVSPRFSSLLDNKEFWNSICALGIDEMHLIHDWGLSGFRKAFTDIGLVFARLKPSTILLAVTATLPTVDIKSITDTLGLKAGTYSFMRRSNIRHDVKLVIRTLRHGLSGWTFPDLRWIVEGTRKTIIYGDTITLIYRLLVYFWHEVTPSIPRRIRFRMYASICDQEYNSETRRLFEVDPHCQVVLATDAAKVGNDWSAIADAIILNPKDPNDIIQKSGRVGRKRGAVRSPRAFVYFTKAQMDKAVNLSINPTGNGKKGKQGTGKDEWLTEDMVSIMTGACTTAEINRIYDNPINDPPCSCETCLSTITPLASGCNCGFCEPEPLPNLPPLQRAKTSRKVSTMRPALTEKQSEELRKDILTWQHNIWQNSNDARIRNMPPRSLLDKSAVDKLVARIMAISEAKVKMILSECISPLETYHLNLWQHLLGLRSKFPNSQTSVTVPATFPSNVQPGQERPYREVRNTTHTFPPTSYDMFFSQLRPSSRLHSPLTEAVQVPRSVVARLPLEILMSSPVNVPPTQYASTNKRKVSVSGVLKHAKSKRHKEN